jgi:hypothetical protein
MKMNSHENPVGNNPSVGSNIDHMNVRGQLTNLTNQALQRPHTTHSDLFSKPSGYDGGYNGANSNMMGGQSNNGYTAVAKKLDNVMGNHLEQKNHPTNLHHANSYNNFQYGVGNGNSSQSTSGGYSNNNIPSNYHGGYSQMGSQQVSQQGTQHGFGHNQGGLYGASFGENDGAMAARGVPQHNPQHLQEISQRHEKLINMILTEEEEIISLHRKHIDDMVELVKQVGFFTKKTKPNIFCF